MPVSEMTTCLLPTTRDQQIIISLHNCNGQYHNIIIIFIFLLSSKCFLSFIDDGMACVNTQLNWTCPGGYLNVYLSSWRTANDCERSFSTPVFHPEVKMHMQYKCDNKTTCVFTVEESIFGVSCVTCSRLDYSYACLCKSLVVLR